MKAGITGLTADGSVNCTMIFSGGSAVTFPFKYTNDK